MPAAEHQRPADASKIERESAVPKYIPAPLLTTRGLFLTNGRFGVKGSQKESADGESRSSEGDAENAAAEVGREGGERLEAAAARRACEAATRIVGGGVGGS